MKPFSLLRFGCAGLAAAALTICAFASSPPASAQDASVSPATCGVPAKLSSAELAYRNPNFLRYDVDAPVIDYGAAPTTNPIARLQERINSGEVKLEYKEPRGYLDSMLAALDIDPASQILVYSTSSLQIELIRAATPRALYFGDDAYIGWIPGTKFLEIAAFDCQKGPVFYTLSNSPEPPRLTRETNRCLACHDSLGLAGGGTPQMLANSIPSTIDGSPLRPNIYSVITDQTPFKDRWGGWYVTGHSGSQLHRGNVQVRSQQELDQTDFSRTINRDSVEGLFDHSRYLTDKSDIVALMVFEHQTSVQSKLATTNFRARTVLSQELGKDGVDTAWKDLPPALQTRLVRIVDPSADALLQARAISLTDKVTGGSGFDAQFMARGVHDPQGRSLRDLDLQTRLFRYPVSYLIYSPEFDGLPRSVREYIYQRIDAVLQGRETNVKFEGQSPQARQAALEILRQTKPDFVLATQG